MSSFAEAAIQFFSQVKLDSKLPRGISVMNPYQDSSIMPIVSEFLTNNFSDNQRRTFLWGINPGRFGGGITGIPFTDPFALKSFLNIDSDIKGHRETSSIFMYDMINHFGGSKLFFQNFFFCGLCPLGFTKEGLNYNFYANEKLYQSVRPFMIQSIQSQIDFGASTNVSICLGAGQLYKVFSELNKENHFFKKIIAIEHPRFIMQYRRKQIKKYIDKYIHTLNLAHDENQKT